MPASAGIHKITALPRWEPPEGGFSKEKSPFFVLVSSNIIQGNKKLFLPTLSSETRNCFFQYYSVDAECPHLIRGIKCNGAPHCFFQIYSEKQFGYAVSATILEIQTWGISGLIFNAIEELIQTAPSLSLTCHPPNLSSS